MKSTIKIIALILTFGAVCHGMTKTVRQIPLGDSTVTINIYEHGDPSMTIYAPHHNEQIGLILAREYVEKRGGRLIEVVSTDDRGRPLRNVRFSQGGREYSFDPNRIFTANGRNCALPAEINAAVAEFSKVILNLLLAPDFVKLRDKEKFLVAVHNNTDVTMRAGEDASSDLTAVSYVRQQSTPTLVNGSYEAQADGVFLSNMETDEDNFIFLSSMLYLNYFAEKGFNVVIQKAPSKLRNSSCKVDDGSMSVYAGQNLIPYICLEADGVNGSSRQRLMMDAVYALL